MTSIRLVIVDDHPVVRDGLRGMFAGVPDIEVVGEAADGNQGVEVAIAQGADVVLMDLRMPGGDGVTAIRQLAARSPTTHVLVLTTYDTDRDVVAAIAAGATGYLLKDSPRDELFRAVRAAHRGESVLAPAVTDRLMSQLRAPVREPLTQREVQVLELMSQGMTNRAIAGSMFISEATVKTHLVHIYAKLGVGDRAGAVATAFELGLLGMRG
jgi:DNA-binding NarL/FixJ family response regulator